MTNWPPLTAPAWPPVELAVIGRYECDNLFTLEADLSRNARGTTGWLVRNPTAAERAAFFTPVLCGDGHTVTGRMLQSPLGVRYPFAVCDEPSHREAFVLWPPYSCGNLSG